MTFQTCDPNPSKHLWIDATIHSLYTVKQWSTFKEVIMMLMTITMMFFSSYVYYVYFVSVYIFCCFHDVTLNYWDMCLSFCCVISVICTLCHVTGVWCEFTRATSLGSWLVILIQKSVRNFLLGLLLVTLRAFAQCTSNEFLQRTAMLALQALYCLRQFRPSVSVTRRYCVKTTARSLHCQIAKCV